MSHLAFILLADFGYPYYLLKPSFSSRMESTYLWIKWWYKPRRWIYKWGSYSSLFSFHFEHNIIV